MSSLSLESTSVSDNSSIQSEDGSAGYSPNSGSLKQFLFHSMTTELELMSNELDLLVKTASADKQPSFRNEMDSFYSIFERFLNQKDREKELDWYKINNLGPDKLIPYAELPAIEEDDAKICHLLSKLAVVKLNGGLGTSMGCVGPKSTIEIRDRMTILDLTIQQIEVQTACAYISR
ncbi:hypothetical protein DI09_111p90 [Mitosporidium daphniae]|uniref:UTP--glucose-1-phosphate uridylyltransferase n=1 Tax=Mitosporidium daphniae TaxID=1485682 RepID=A0A098VW30_9MICR|nr:uncharacterized protein DI09_111p90 [Mitosporidium daphniae]KGG53084.1 hypothetical protein DI09_111p90 [Mitosporidium daphniae]|eukprot:XP_013239526.1 uncharacterized protein DI09_111p90 [Mitosporidium daphniae]